MIKQINANWTPDNGNEVNIRYFCFQIMTKNGDIDGYAFDTDINGANLLAADKTIKVRRLIDNGIMTDENANIIDGKK